MVTHVFLIKHAQKIIKVADPFQFARDIPGLALKVPCPRSPKSQANQRGWVNLKTTGRMKSNVGSTTDRCVTSGLCLSVLVY